MTTQQQSGMDVKQFKKEMAELKPGEGVKIDKETTYDYGADLNTQSTPMMDAQEGKPVLIRMFEFKMNPLKMKEFPNDLQKIFNNHAKQISTILWGDGLVPFESVAPRVIIDRKGAKYQIFVTCEARRGVLFSQQPKGLTEVFSKASQNGSTRN